MKRIGILILCLTLVFSVGCAKKVNKDQAVNNGEQVNAGRQLTPESTLRRAMMNISRVQQSDQKLTADQKTKLIAIINHIKAQTTIEKTYSDTKSAEITAVFTDAQKQVLNNRQMPQNGQNSPDSQNGAGRRRNGGQPPQLDGANQQPPQQMQQPQGQQQNQGQQRQFGQQVSLKELCDNILKELQ